MKRSQLTQIVKEEIQNLVKETLSEIERGPNEISTAEREQIEHEAIRQIAKKKFGKDYDKLPGRDKLAAGRKFLDDSDKQKGRLQKALKILQAKGKIDPNKVYTAGTFYENKDEDAGYDDDEKKAHKAASKGAGGKEAKGAAAQHTAGLKKQEEINSIKGELKKNAKEMSRIIKIDKSKRTKADESLLDDMRELTKKKKKLESQI